MLYVQQYLRSYSIYIFLLLAKVTLHRKQRVTLLS
jgi:hypothetical protein